MPSHDQRPPTNDHPKTAALSLSELVTPSIVSTHWSERAPGDSPWRKELSPLFDGLNDVDANTALRRFDQRHLTAGEVLCREGDVADTLISVQEGQLEIRSHGELLGTAGTDSLVGEMGLFEDATRTADVIAGTDSTVLVLTRDGYEELRSTVHPAVRNIERAALRLQVERLRSTGARVKQLLKGTRAEPVSVTERFYAGVRRLFGPGGMFSTSDADPLRAVGASELFCDVPESFVSEIAAQFKPASYREGQVLCTQGEPGDWMFVLDRGEVDVVISGKNQDPQRVATLGPGSAFGMVAMVIPGPRMASVVARTSVVVHALGPEAWRGLIAHPWGTGSAFRRAVIKAFGEQLRTTNTQVVAYEQGRDVDALQLAKAGLT